MSIKTINSRVVSKHDIENNWKKAVNFIPLKGEIIIYDADEEYTYQRLKIGDGVSNVNELPFSIEDCVANVLNISENNMGSIDDGTIVES